jgi:hypothetical protein
MTTEDPRFDAPSEQLTPPRSHHDVPYIAPVPPTSNKLGMIAFILSFPGLCLPIPLGIAALVCGIIAVRREPRAFAIAAIAISALSTFLMIPLGLAMVLPALAVGRHAARKAKTRVSALAVLDRVEEFREDNTRNPADIVECYGAEIPPLDAWGTPLKLTWTGEGMQAKPSVWSAGPDLAWDSSDDVLQASGPKTTGNAEKPSSLSGDDAEVPSRE